MTTDDVVDSSAGELDSAAVEGQGEQVSHVALSAEQRVGLLEALLLASGDPLPINRIEEILGCGKSEVLELADVLKQQ
jgi:DNA-binding transcriptional regulator GbsR (MarR family)